MELFGWTLEEFFQMPLVFFEYSFTVGDWLAYNFLAIVAVGFIYYALR